MCFKYTLCWHSWHWFIKIIWCSMLFVWNWCSKCWYCNSTEARKLVLTHRCSLQSTLHFFLKVCWHLAISTPLVFLSSFFLATPLRLMYLDYVVARHFDVNASRNQGERNQASNWVSAFDCSLPGWSAVISCLSQRWVMGADTLWTHEASRGPPGTAGNSADLIRARKPNSAALC